MYVAIISMRSLVAWICVLLVLSHAYTLVISSIYVVMTYSYVWIDSYTVGETHHDHNECVSMYVHAGS